MSLPNGFKNSYEYFQHAVDFLRQYSWIYREANTEFLKAGILNDMPEDYKTYLIEIENKELNKFPYVHQPLSATNPPTSVMNFRYKLAKLIPIEAYDEPKNTENQIKFQMLKKMSIKKQHEIHRLAVAVKETLKLKMKDNEDSELNKYVLIDFGCGLGYLSELLYKLNENLLILGLESDAYRIKAAEKRVKSYMPTTINSIHYRQQFITENSKDFIVENVEELLKLNYEHVSQQITTKMVIIGLHACADLTITSMKLFFQMSQVQYLLIMPCCYHKLQMCNNAAATSATSTLKFKNFPISENLEKVLLESDTVRHNYGGNNEHYTSYLNRPFLRLACQQTLKRWSKCSQLEHQVHGSEMFFRAVAESLKLEKEKVELSVVKRKEEKIDFNSLDVKQRNSFETFSRIYALKSKVTNTFEPWSEYHRKKFENIMEKYPNGSKLAEGLTCLQTSMQKLCENLVLYDRLCYMEETALKMNLNIKVRYEKIMDEELSPRCYVLIAEKL